MITMLEKKGFEELVDVLFLVTKEDVKISQLFKYAKEKARKEDKTIYEVLYELFGRDPYIRQSLEMLLGKNALNLYPHLNNDMK